MLSGFRDFITRGNVVDLAVGVAIGAAFTALVATFGTSFIEPLIGLLLGGGVEGGTYTVNGQVFDVGGFVNAVITFLITAAALYFVVVAPMNAYLARRNAGKEEGPITKDCPECLSTIPQAARRCAHCTALQPADA